MPFVRLLNDMFSTHNINETVFWNLCNYATRRLAMWMKENNENVLDIYVSGITWYNVSKYRDIKTNLNLWNAF